MKKTGTMEKMKEPRKTMKPLKKLLLFSLLFAALFICSGSVFAYENPIRVRLAAGTNQTGNFSLQVAAGQYTLANADGVLATVASGQTVAIQMNANAYTVTAAGNRYTGSGAITLAPVTAASYFSYGDKSYNGDAVVLYNSGAGAGTVYLVNTLGMEEYLYGVVGPEIGGYSPADEALKAQAVASRCLAFYWKKSNASGSYDVTNTTSHQVYEGRAGRDRGNWNQIQAAVDATSSQVMYYKKDNGDEVLVEGYYCANTGGHTADVEDVWGSDPNRYPYLRGVTVPYDGLPFQSGGSMKFPTSYLWTKIYSWADIKAAAENAAGKSLGVLQSIVIDRGGNTGGYIASIQFVGSTNTVTFNRSAARTAFGFRSQLYDVFVSERLSSSSVIRQTTTISGKDFDNAIFRSGQFVVFKGRGYGHGVGMSQWGACVMAEQGKPYTEILQYFFNKNLNNGRLSFKSYKG